MSEKIVESREVYFTMTGNDVFVVIQPPLTDDMKVGFPAPPFGAINLDEPLFENGSQVITLKEYKDSGHWRKNLEVFMGNVIRHLTDAKVDITLHHVHPETIFGYGAAPVATIETS